MTASPRTIPVIQYLQGIPTSFRANFSQQNPYDPVILSGVFGAKNPYSLSFQFPISNLHLVIRKLQKFSKFRSRGFPTSPLSSSTPVAEVSQPRPDELLEIVRSNELAQTDALKAPGLLEGNEQAAAGLLALARDAGVDDWVRRNAAEALGQLGQGDQAVLSGLLVLAQDASVASWVRRDAAEALGRLGQGNNGILSGLLALARDERVGEQVDEQVRSAAYESLKVLLGGETLAK